MKLKSSITRDIIAVEVYCGEIVLEEDAELILTPNIPNVVRFVNDSYVVQCSPRGQNLTLLWLNPQHQRIESHRGRVYIEHIMGNLSLVINPIAKEDSGVWYCRDKDELLTANINLTVQGKCFVSLS